MSVICDMYTLWGFFVLFFKSHVVVDETLFYDVICCLHPLISCWQKKKELAKLLY